MDTRRALAYTHPQLAAQWHLSLNPSLTPYDVSSGSVRDVWWRCEADRSHVWRARIQNRARLGSPCPICSGHAVTSTNSLRATYPELAAEWHATLNGSLTADMVKPGSGKRIWWQCRTRLSHVWRAAAFNRTKSGTGCPFCARQNRRAKGMSAQLAPNSQAGRLSSAADADGTRQGGNLRVAFPEIASEWHPRRNGNLRPDRVTPGSGKKVWWRCRIDQSHQWCATVGTRTKSKSGCPFCSGRIVRRGASLAELRPDLSREWHPTKNAGLRPWDVSLGSSRKVWWRCARKQAHVWQARIFDRAKRGAGCPTCNSRRA